MSPATTNELSPRRKRQIALLYHFASLDYLKGLLPQTEELIRFADQLATARAPLDPALMSRQWGARDTSGNWSTYAFPALVQFRESTLWHIQARAQEIYGITGAHQCARMLAEYSLLWMLPEQEKRFKEKFEAVYKYAAEIDEFARRPRTSNDFTFWITWNEQKDRFQQLPKLRIRTDVEGETRKVPPRTGVYIPQDDEWGAPQFAWSGGQLQEDGSRWYGGQLDEVVTFDPLLREAAEAIGRDVFWLWDDPSGALAFARERKLEYTSYEGVTGPVDTPEAALIALKELFISRPTRWHYVELIEGEYEDTHEPVVQRIPTRGPGLYASSGESCPYPGVWECLEHPLGPQTFAYGVVMPHVEGQVVTWQLKKVV